ncbi:MAG: L-histidine N(alpha)-methyltransferase [Acidobacteriaceae bacterium]|nr:L-histidine N(alpha)-methyltransferase [Acidobacteriaceae bacterium]MBV9780225.1 L-histidine N(alpha)-methyltransferase [Acidobacteriaceae bacterium]
MPAPVGLQLSQFALDVADGLGRAGQKEVPPRYFYDDLGSILFEAITLLPEYGLTRADERLLGSHSDAIVSETGPVALIAELGSGSGRKTRYILEAALRRQREVTYRPIDVSASALEACERELSNISEVQPICADWMEGLNEVAQNRATDEPLLLLFLGSSIGNVKRCEIVEFLRHIRWNLRAGDFFLVGADLVKNEQRMIAAYDDPTGVTAAFNLNLLGRMNRELDADFDLRSFVHEARWNSSERCIEMHLRSQRDQVVHVGEPDLRVGFREGETICTELSHKFTQAELISYAHSSGFDPVTMWMDRTWPFVEALWRADER